MPDPYLQRQIEEAKAAAQRIAELDNLRVQAEALPALEAAQTAQEQAESLRAQAEHNLAEAKAILDDLRRRIPDWRRRYTETYAALLTLLAEGNELGKEIRPAYDLVSQAAQLQTQAVHLTLGHVPEHQLALTLQAVWRQAGGESDELNLSFADIQMDYHLREWLRTKRSNTYIASMGIRNFGVFR